MSTTSSDSPLLLVMCTGNVCRSPMAEALFKHYLKERNLTGVVFSRGLAAPVGRPPHPYAVQVSREHGVPLSSDKKAEAVTSAEIGLSTAIFIMDSSHRREIQRRFPGAVGKTFLLGQWQNQEINDPVNEPLSAFETTWRQCHIAVRAWVDRLCDVGLIRAKEVV